MDEAVGLWPQTEKEGLRLAALEAEVQISGRGPEEALWRASLANPPNPVPGSTVLCIIHIILYYIMY